MTIQLNYTENEWRHLHEKWSQWWTGDLPECLVVFEQKGPDYPANVPDFINQLPFETPVEQVVDLYQNALENTLRMGDAWPKWFINFGPGIISGFLGARVVPRQDTIWFEPAGDINLDSLTFQFDPNNVWFKRVRDIIDTAVNRWGDRICVSFPDLGENFDILSAFRPSGQLLTDFYDRPDTIRRLINELTALWISFYEIFYEIIIKSHRGTTPWASIWSPKKCYMLQCDFSYMISPNMFEQFVLQDLTACSNHLDHAFYHMDGVGQIPHLDLLLSIESLKGIQWVHGDGQPGHSHWIDLLKRIRDAEKLCQLYITADDALAVVKTLGQKGFAFHILDTMTSSQANDFIQTIKHI